MIEREREMSNILKVVCIKEQLYELIFKFQQETVYPEDIDKRALAILEICSAKREVVNGSTANTEEKESYFAEYRPEVQEY